MGNAAIVLNLAITGLSRLIEMQQLLQTAAAEGRDVTDAEVEGLRLKAAAAIDALEAAKRPPPA